MARFRRLNRPLVTVRQLDPGLRLPGGWPRSGWQGRKSLGECLCARDKEVVFAGRVCREPAPRRRTHAIEKRRARLLSARGEEGLRFLQELLGGAPPGISLRVAASLRLQVLPQRRGTQDLLCACEECLNIAAGNARISHRLRQSEVVHRDEDRAAGLRFRGGDAEDLRKIGRVDHRLAFRQMPVEIGLREVAGSDRKPALTQLFDAPDVQFVQLDVSRHQHFEAPVVQLFVHIERSPQAALGTRRVHRLVALGYPAAGH